MRAQAWTIFFALASAACGPQATPIPPESPTSAWTMPAFEPVLVEPHVAPDAVPASFDALATTNGDDLLRFFEDRLAPGSIGDETRADIRRAAPTGKSTFIVSSPRLRDKSVFVQRTPRDGRSLVLHASKDGFFVPPVAWIAKVVDVPGAAPAAVEAWFRALAARLATSGRASGVVVFGTGNADAIVLDLRPAGDSGGDVQLVARSRFARAGEIDVNAWGTKITGASSVKVSKMNGHEGISVRDVLRKMEVPAAPSPPPGTAL